MDRALLKQDVDRLWMGYIARDKAGNPLGSTLLIFDDHCGYYLVGGVKRGLPGALGHANSLCMDGLIRFCLETGRVFDFEGSTIPSIALFFSQMGGKQTPFYRVSRFHSVRYNLLRAIGNIKAVRKLTK